MDFKSTYEKARLQKLTYGSRAPDGPFCFKDIGEFVVNQRLSDNPCEACSQRKQCQENFDSIKTRALTLEPECFGDLKLRIRFRGYRCGSCPIAQNCGDWIDALHRRDLPTERITWPACSTRGDTVTPTALSASPDLNARSVATRGPVPDLTPARAPASISRSSEPSPSSGGPLGEATASPSYAFPNCDVFNRTLVRARAEPESAVIVDKVDQLSWARRPDHTLSPYGLIRAQLCALSIVLNERHGYPPAFRDTRGLSAKPKGWERSDDERVLSNDLQVIDMHWAWCQSSLRPSGEWKRLGDREGFDFDLASDLAGKAWRAETKADRLGISESLHHYLAVIKNKRVTDSRRHLLAQRGVVENRLAELQMAGRLRMSPERAQLVPDAYVALRIANGSVPAALRSFTLITGKGIASKDMEKVKQWLVKEGLLTRPKRIPRGS